LNIPLARREHYSAKIYNGREIVRSAERGLNNSTVAYGRINKMPGARVLNGTREGPETFTLKNTLAAATRFLLRDRRI